MAKVDRRKFIKGSGATLGMGVLASGLPNFAFAMITAESARPQLQQGIQIGDVSCDRSLIWSRSDRPARMFVEYSYHENFYHSQTIPGPYALEKNDFTARLDLTDLVPDRDVFIRVGFQDLSNDRIVSETVNGHFRTASLHNSRDLHFVWGGDTAGQGWGINPDFGGMKIYSAMRNEKPDFFYSLRRYYLRRWPHQ